MAVTVPSSTEKTTAPLTPFSSPSRSTKTVLSMKRTPFLLAVARTLTVMSRSTQIIAVIGPVGITFREPSSLRGMLTPQESSLSIMALFWET